ncbi:MAG: nucleotidyl transferase AbiEii/AbiGii toxin family protein [Myxococcaceae bacterium]
MSFVHEVPDFDDLLQIVAVERKLSLGLVEKDYWVTHTLWALHAGGFEVWFKGGTSLSKGFGLIQRFSEDLELKIEPGTVAALPKVSSWKSEGAKATAQRKAYFESLPELLSIPGAQLALDPDTIDKTWRGANIRVTYPGRHLGDLKGVMRPFVQLEIGSARVTPFVSCHLTSFAHEKLEAQRQLGAFTDNRPRNVRCVHPLVTLIEKLDALHRRFPNERAEPATFIRHYEDAARVIAAGSTLPPLPEYGVVRALANDILAQRQIVALPTSTDPALTPTDEARWTAIRAAHAAIGQMFWGPRISIEDACATIRGWIGANFGLPEPLALSQCS